MSWVETRLLIGLVSPIATATKGREWCIPGRSPPRSAWRPVRRMEHPMSRAQSAIFDWLLWWCADIGETVLDPFMGSGTFGVSCAKLGLPFIGIEIEPKYFDALHDGAISEALASPHACHWMSRSRLSSNRSSRPWHERPLSQTRGSPSRPRTSSKARRSTRSRPRCARPGQRTSDGQRAGSAGTTSSPNSRVLGFVLGRLKTQINEYNAAVRAQGRSAA